MSDSSGITFSPIIFFSYVVGITGPTGPTGPAGSTGANGPSIIGPTGPTGATLVNIIKLSDGFFEFFYSDGTSKLSSTKIEGASGYAKINLTGLSLAAFSPLSNSLLDQTYNNDFPINVLTFKGISSTYPLILSVRYAQNANPPETVVVDYSAVNIGFIGISGGSIGNLLENKTGQKQYGITLSNYNDDEKALIVQNKNLQEGLVLVQPIVFSNSLVCYKIDPDEGSIFYINPYTSELSSNPGIHGFAFLVKKPELGNFSSGISLHLSNGFTHNDKIYYATYEDESDISNGITFGSQFYERFDISGIAWQDGSYFCPGKNQFNVINMISLGGRYLAIPAQYAEGTASSTSVKTTLSESCYPFETEEDIDQGVNFSDGLCCPASCGDSISQTIYANCTGYFIHNKTIANSSLCSRLGFCCYNSGSASADLTFCQCKALDANAIWHPYEGLRENSSFFTCNSDYIQNEKGACCSGLGTGTIKTKIECINSKNYFQGIGTNIFGIIAGIQKYVCQGGTGACCDKGITCNNDIPYNNCQNVGRFGGDGSVCEVIDCAPDKIPCSFAGGVTELKQGDEYAGGIVLDYFDFSNTITGHAFFDNTDPNYLIYPSPLTDFYSLPLIKTYKSIKDHGGYGINAIKESDLCENKDTFVIIIAKEDVEISGNKNFLWSKNQLSWGPLYDPITFQIDSNDILVKGPTGEGRIFDTSDDYVSRLVTNSLTYKSCESSRIINDYSQWLFDRPFRSMHGLWTRNYGLYNTARICGSRISAFDPAYAPDPEYINDKTIADAITKFNIDNPPESPNESSWFIPSHDEMGLIANLALLSTDFNINSSLLIQGFEPVNGVYWTSTGSFNLSLSEGTLSATQHGSRAWQFNINDTTVTATTQRRVTSAKVRPIKILRCDGRYPLPGSSNYKLWRLPLINT